MVEKQKIQFTRSIDCRTYPEGFRRKVVQEYLDSGRPKLHIQKEHNIRYKSAINKWLVDFGIDDPYSKKAYLSKRIIIDLKKENEINLSSLSTADLEKKVADLERKLEDERIRSLAYLRMIEIAEKDYKLPIRKKPNTK